jgi:hypothetical protein
MPKHCPGCRPDKSFQKTLGKNLLKIFGLAEGWLQKKQSPARGGALQHGSELAIASWPMAPGGVLMGMLTQRPEQGEASLKTTLFQVQRPSECNTHC